VDAVGDLERYPRQRVPERAIGEQGRPVADELGGVVGRMAAAELVVGGTGLLAGDD